MEEIGIVEEAVELLPRISTLAAACVAADQRIAGLTLAQAKTLSLLYHSGDLTVSEVASGLHTGLPAASELIERLIERGMLVRAAHPTDRRSSVIGLSDEAMEIGRWIHDLRRAQIRAALAQIDSGDWPVFIDSLRALASALEQSAATPTGNIPAVARAR